MSPHLSYLPLPFLVSWNQQHRRYCIFQFIINIKLYFAGNGIRVINLNFNNKLFNLTLCKQQVLRIRKNLLARYQKVKRKNDRTKMYNLQSYEQLLSVYHLYIVFC